MNVVIIGGGIAGLSSATVLAELGNNVTLIERNNELGGFVRSHYDKLNYYQEHTPRVFFHNYYNFFNIMDRIPIYYQKQKTDKKLRDIFQKMDSNYLVDKYGLTSTSIFKIIFKSRLNLFELLSFGFFILRYMMCSTERLQDDADRIGIGSFIKNESGRKRFEMLSFIMGEPLEKLPLHKVVRLIEQNLATETLYTLKGNTNEFLFHNWELYLREIGVKVIKNIEVERISTVKNTNTYSVTTNKKNYTGFGKVIVATDLWNMISLFERSNIKVDPHIYELSEQAKSNQMGVNIYFNSLITFKSKSIYALENSDWKLIIEPKDNNWKDKPNIGIWSVSIPDENLFSTRLNKTLKQCTQNEIFDEIWHQIYNSRIFDATELPREQIIPMYYKIWDGWEIRENSVVNKEPYFLNAIGTFGKRPKQFINMKDIFLAGAYTNTSYYHYWVEGACESGLEAAQLIDFRTKIHKHRRIKLFKLFHNIDKYLYDEYLPCTFDFTLVIILGLFLYKFK